MDFETFYNSMYSMAIAYTVKKIQNVQDAEDLVCDAFMYCYDHYSQYDPQKASLKTWLFVILTSRIKNYYRDKKVLVPLDEIEGLADDRSGDSLEQAAALQDAREMLAKALKELSEPQRQIVYYRYFRGYDTEETAQRVGLAPGNVRTQLSRALAKIRVYCEKAGMMEE